MDPKQMDASIEINNVMKINANFYKPSCVILPKTVN